MIYQLLRRENEEPSQKCCLNEKNMNYEVFIQEMKCFGKTN